MKDIPTVQQPTPPQQPVYSAPMYPMPQPPERPRGSRNRLWLIIGIIAVVLVISIVGAGIAASQSPKTSTPSATQSTQQVTTQPTQPQATQPTQQVTPLPPQANTIGQPVQVGDTWVVTVNSAKTHGPGEFSQPKSGNTYLVVDVTLKNISAKNQIASSLMMFDLKDQTGQRYNDTFTDFAKSSPDGTVSPGSLLRGELVYEVPSSMHTFTFSFVPDFLSNGLVEWNVTV